MTGKKVLYVSSEVIPYLPSNDISSLSYNLPKMVNQNGGQTRIFIPKYGIINERRHQLHEVIRLSGMNLIIDDFDHQLIIKVASIPAARIQVYFIDNEDYFKRKGTWVDKENKFYKDNGERTLFFCKSVIETIKKLGWKPDIIHFMGWMSTAMPAYLRQFNADDPYFNDAKLVYSLFGDGFDGKLDPGFTNGINFDGLENMQEFNTPSADNLYAGAVKHVDAVLTMNDDIPEVQLDSAASAGIPIIDGKKFIENPAELDSFYESLFE